MFIPQASNSAHTVDSAFSYILAIEVALLVLVTSVMVLFVIKYNRKKKGIPANIEGNMLLEITWTVIPTLIVLVMFYIGWKSFSAIRSVPKEEMTINVSGRQWSWRFSYENGKQSDTLNVPLGKPVKLLLSSEDVIHSFYVPAFRIKEDCVPKTKTYMTFTAEREGSYDIFCTEYCGLGHSGMISKVEVMPPGAFDKWYAASAAKKTDVQELLAGKGCLGCHTIDGTAKIGPTFKGLYGRKVTVVTAGRERDITADEDYIARSIRKPNEDIVKGYPSIMPKLGLSDEEIEEIIEYMKALK